MYLLFPSLSRRLQTNKATLTDNNKETLCLTKTGPLLHFQTRRALGGEHVPQTKLFPQLAVNKTILKPRLAAATGTQYLYVGFSPT